MSTLRLLPFALLALLASCQSMSEGVISLEARALILDDAELDDVESGSAFDEDNIDLSGYGAHVALMTPIIDLLGGVEEREYGNESAPELTLGVRRRFLEIWRVHPFIEGNLRYGFDLDNGASTDDYAGWNVGVGALLDLTDHLFLNARLMYETTSIDLPTSSTDVTGVVGTVGLGFSF